MKSVYNKFFITNYQIENKHMNYGVLIYKKSIITTNFLTNC